jgi:hypothetical protein
MKKIRDRSEQGVKNAGKICFKKWKNKNNCGKDEKSKP